MNQAMAKKGMVQGMLFVASVAVVLAWAGVGFGQDRDWDRDRDRDRDRERSSRYRSGSSSSSSSRDGGVVTAGQSYNDFSILTERNIFLKDRRRYERESEQGSSTTRPAEAPRRPEQSFVLRGFVIQDNARLAFIENASTYETIKAAVGDPVLNGKIVSMDLDSLEYEANGVRTRVSIGHNLTGTAGAVSGGSYGSSSGSSSESSSSSSSPPASAEEAAILERLRARRQQGR